MRSFSEYIRLAIAGVYPVHESMAEYIRAYQSKATEIAIEAGRDGPPAELPPHYHDFLDVFAKTEFDRLPERKPWDHARSIRIAIPHL